MEAWLINSFDYESLISKIRLLETKMKRIELEKDFLKDIKPVFYEFDNRKKWKNRFQKLLLEEKNTYFSLQDAYTELENLWEEEKKN